MPTCCEESGSPLQRRSFLLVHTLGCLPVEQYPSLSISWMLALMCSSHWAPRQCIAAVASKGRAWPPAGSSFDGPRPGTATSPIESPAAVWSWGMSEMFINGHCSPPDIVFLCLFSPCSLLTGVCFLGGSWDCFHTEHRRSRYTCRKAAFFNIKH